MYYIKLIYSKLTIIIISPVLLITFGKLIIKLMSAPGVGYVSYNYRDTMFFTAMKNILSKDVVHIQNEEEIDVMLHQNAFVIIDTLMNNVFHSNFLTQIERLKPVHVIIFSPFNIKRCLGKYR